MSSSETYPFSNTLRWLVRYAGFPASRLTTPAERLLLLAAAAQADEEGDASRPSFLVKTRDAALDSAQRQHAERRRRVHYKCDNSAKV